MHCQYVFDSQQVDLSTTDYVVKIWGPIIEAVFRPSKSYFTWFGQDCVFGKFSGSPIGESDDEIYVTRKHLDAFFGDTSGSAERIKLLIFGKAILNEMVNTGVHTVYILHTAALELQVISLALVANGLYVAHTVDRIYIPTSMKKFDELPQSFIPKLLAFRDTVCGLMEKNNSIPSEGNIQGKVNENCSCTSAKGVSTPSNLWIRNVWIPSQHQN
ncbi:hypothetical protein BJV82DRAFT_363401 [Fennellomyces sp. T-0311]|nr:hypothetical protein BJV82DRAFT_363401 [Fennellomyces sp. T-0311]